VKYIPAGWLAPFFFGKTVYEYTAGAISSLDIKAFKKAHMKEYKRMVKRTPGAGSFRDNMYAFVLYSACYAFSYYKAAPDEITTEVLDGLIDAVVCCDFHVVKP